MHAPTLEFVNVSLVYPSMSQPLFESLDLRLGGGWTGIVGPNGAGKTTLLRLACGEIEPSRGRIIAPRQAIHCPQRTDEPAEGWEDFVAASDPFACELRGRLGVESDWAERWDTLSHGERKRAQIGVALWRRPQVLALDEPTNHIDLVARQMLLAALRGFRGTGLLVSHDRALLDELCGQCLFLKPPAVVARPGGYTAGQNQAQAEHARARHEREQARRELTRLSAEAAERAREAAASHRKRSKSGLAHNDMDSRAKINLARYTGKDGQAGRLLRQLDGRLERSRQRLDGIFVEKQRRLSADLVGEQSGRNALLRVPPGAVTISPGRRLTLPALTIAPDSRIALTGPNGGGKTTLVTHLLNLLDLPPDRLVYLPQEIDQDGSSAIVQNVRRLEPRRLGALMSAVACLGSEPQRVLETDQPSPGELRKLLLALGMTHRPHLIVMDEPTNHLDLPSIECLEQALADCRCALLLVSHDLRFLAALTSQRWHIEPDTGGNATLAVSTGWV